MNIKISSLQGDTVFLLPALTSLCVQHFFPPLSCDRLFLIFAWIYFASSFDPESSLARLARGLHSLGSGSSGAGRSFPISLQFGPALGRQQRSWAELGCTGQGHVPGAHGPAGSPSLTWGSMWRAAPGTSLPTVELLIPILTWEAKGQEIPAESPWPLGEKGFLQRPGTACKQWLKLRRGFHAQAGSWECCASLCQAVLEEEITLRNAGEGRLQSRECCTHTLRGAPAAPRPAVSCMEQEQPLPAKSPKPTQWCLLSVTAAPCLRKKPEAMDTVL